MRVTLYYTTFSLVTGVIRVHIEVTWGSFRSTWTINDVVIHGWAARWGRGSCDRLALLLAGAEPEVAVAGGPAAALLLGAGAAADPVRDAREGVVLALPRAHPRLHHAAAVV